MGNLLTYRKSLASLRGESIVSCLQSASCLRTYHNNEEYHELRFNQSDTPSTNGNVTHTIKCFAKIIHQCAVPFNRININLTQKLNVHKVDTFSALKDVYSYPSNSIKAS